MPKNIYKEKYEELEVRCRNLEIMVAGLKQELAVARAEERMKIAAQILKGEGE
jgi:hypothetical protein